MNEIMRKEERTSGEREWRWGRERERMLIEKTVREERCRTRKRIGESQIEEEKVRDREREREETN